MTETFARWVEVSAAGQSRALYPTAAAAGWRARTDRSGAGALANAPWAVVEGMDGGSVPAVVDVSESEGVRARKQCSRS